MPTPTVRVAFLRGVNVGGITVKSAPLRATFEALGFDDVRTVLASGNVVFRAPGAPATLKKRIEQALRDDFGYDAWIVLRSAAEVEAVVEGCPLPARDGWHTYVVLASDAAALAELAATDTDDAHDRTAVGDGVLYWQVQEGHTLDSPFGKTVSRAKYRTTTTNRNLRTMQKVVAAARAVADH